MLSSMPKDSVALYPAAPALFMTEDVPYLYHPSTDLMYLTGCTEPATLLMLDTTEGARRRDKQNNLGQSHLFLRSKDPRIEQWDGPMLGTGHDTRELFGVDAVHANHWLPSAISERMEQQEPDLPLQRFYFDVSKNPMYTELVSRVQSPKGTSLASIWLRNWSPKKFVCQSRIIKSPAESVLLRMAASCMSKAFNDAMAMTILRGDECVPSSAGKIPERHIEATLEYSCKMHGASRMSFPSVVAGGLNTAVLHYMANNCQAESGDLVMVDAGCEYSGYCSDVSRSWPVSGKFSDPQRLLYELVLDVQLSCIDMAREGYLHRGEKCSLNVIHYFAAERLTEGLKDLGFMKGMSLENALDTRAYSKWFDHSIGHYLGMDVHDTHSVSKDIPLTAGMCVTIEPGVYIRHDDETAPAEFRGIGLRIEVSQCRRTKCRHQVIITLFNFHFYSQVAFDKRDD